MRYLLHVNVLIALLDRSHVQHDAAHEWFAREGQAAWATCPLTERRAAHRRPFPLSEFPGTPAAVAPLIVGLCALPGHAFWPDSISLCDSAPVDSARLLTSTQVTDSYLLGLARESGGGLATFDRRLVTSAVKGGSEALLLIE